MDNKTLASLYALAKVCGFDQSVEDFEIQYSQYYSETLKHLSEKEPKLAKLNALHNPFWE